MVLREKVFIALGAASMCWEHPDRAGIFDSDAAVAVGEELVAWLEEQDREKGQAAQPL